MKCAIGYKGIEDWNIKDIEALTENDALVLCEDRENIKGHNIYFVDFGGYFGFSALVFRNGAYLYYCNDYEMHHAGRTKDDLRKWYDDTLPHKLFTDDELVKSSSDYQEQQNKEYYIRNYYIMQIPYISAFRICTTEKEKKQFKKETAGMIYNPLSFCYVKPEYKGFVQKQAALYKAMQDAKKNNVNDFEFQKNAFLREMFNHEYGINWQADHDTLSAFGSVSWHGDDLGAYFKELGFNDIQKKAYIAARAEYYEKASF